MDGESFLTTYSSVEWPSIQRTTDYWDAWQRSQVKAQSLYTDWADHPTVFREMMRHAFGNPDTDFFEQIHQSFLGLEKAHALSLCCGDGGFERQLLERSIFAKITGLEISPERIAHGQAFLSQLPPGQAPLLDFFQQDVNLGQFGHAQFDVVFAKAALHHIQDLESALKGIEQCLRPGGVLITIDFFGPSRFQWTHEQLDACNWFWANRVPPHLRNDEEGQLLPPITRPSVESMIAMDPSEAARSGELHSLLCEQFTVLTDAPLGGTVLNLLLYGDRVNRFDLADPIHNQVLEEAVAFEHQLIAERRLQSDFRLMVLQRKPG